MNREKIDRIYGSVRKIDQAYETWAVGHGLTLCEMWIYYMMLEEGNTMVTQKNLSMELGIPKTSINSMIKKQLKLGYMEMQTNPGNKREKMLSLTEEGRKFAQELIGPLFQYEEEIALVLDDQEVEIAVKVQNQFADLLMEKIKINTIEKREE